MQKRDFWVDYDFWKVLLLSLSCGLVLCFYFSFQTKPNMANAEHGYFSTGSASEGEEGAGDFPTPPWPRALLREDAEDRPLDPQLLAGKPNRASSSRCFNINDIMKNRVRQLNSVLRSLSHAQRRDVRGIGFDGIIDMYLTDLPMDMFPWLVEGFNPETGPFSVNGQPAFVVTGYDVAGLFKVSFNPANNIIEDESDEEVQQVLTSWVPFCDGAESGSITLSELGICLTVLEEGGDDFKRMFVLYVLHSLLIPTTNLQIRVGLLMSLLNVGEIRGQNWAGFIFNHLCDSVAAYQTYNYSSRCEGCILIAMITYFQNCTWPGIPRRMEVPLIQHWPSYNIQQRITEEIIGGGFGSGKCDNSWCWPKMEAVSVCCLKPELMETDTKVEAPQKKVRKATIPVAELVYGGMAPDDGYVYEMRNKQGGLIEERFMEDSEKGSAIEKLAYCINGYSDIAASNDAKFDHIDIAEKQKVIHECVEAYAWLREKKQLQDSLPKYANAALLVADIMKKSDALNRFCRPIMTQPKPKPAKPATEPASPQPSPQETEQGTGSPNPHASPNPQGDESGAAGNEAPTDEAEPMYTETA